MRALTLTRPNMCPADFMPAIRFAAVTRARARQAAGNIIARRKGVTLGGLNIKDLINEGRP
jgi:hypothetical protein